MTMCPQCGQEVEEDARFCSHCGQEVKTGAEAQSAEAPEPGPGAREVCPGCGQEVEAATAFCAHCGQKQGPGALPPRGQPLLVPQVQDPLTEAFEVRTSDYLRLGWELFKQFPGGFIGFAAILGVVAALERIPYLGVILLLVLGAPLGVGPLIVAAKLVQRQPVQFGDFFSGYHFFGQLVLRDLVMYGIMLVTLLPCAIPLGFLFMMRHRQVEPMLQTGVGVLVGLLGILWLILIIYLAVCWVFSSLLILDRRQGFWPAMELSRHAVKPRWFSFCGFLLLLGLINLAGALACLVGLLVTVPLSACAITVAFADIFGLRSKEY